VSEFISFITSEASDKCLQEKRKTLNGEDIVWALHNMGMSEYVEPLRIYLTKYRDSRGDRLERPDKRPRLTIEELAKSGNFEDSTEILKSVWNPQAHPTRKDKSSRSHAMSNERRLQSQSSGGVVEEDDEVEEEDEEDEDEDD
jgi:hypothetical protein